MVNIGFTIIRAATVLFAAMAATACASLPEPSSMMVKAIPTGAPVAYLDFCARSAADCGGAATEAARRQAMAQVGAGADETRGVPMPAAIQSGSYGKTDWNMVFAEARARKSILNLGAQPALQTLELPVLTADLWARLNKANLKVNHDLLRRSDAASYGVEDYWATPISDGRAAFGDCEDYVLEKRRALASAGVPESAMSIAIVTTPWNETHAVLLVATDKGEYVLDNLSSFILPWRKVGYAWRQRQFGGGPLDWGFAAAFAGSEPLLSRSQIE